MQRPDFDDEYISKGHLDKYLLQGQDFDISHAKETLRSLAGRWRNGEKQVVLQQLLILDRAIFYSNKRLKRLATHDSTRYNGKRFQYARKWAKAKHGSKNSIYSCYPM